MTGPAVSVVTVAAVARPASRLVGKIVVGVATVVAAAAAVAGVGATAASRAVGGDVRVATARVATATDVDLDVDLDVGDLGVASAAAAAAAPSGRDDPATVAFEAALAAGRLATMPPLPVPSLFSSHRGYFTLHVGRGLAAGRVMLEVPAAALDVPFVVTALTSAGDAEQSHAGEQAQPWYWPNVFAFRKAPGGGDNAAAALDLYRPLMALRSTVEAGSNRSAAEALREGYFPGWLHTFPARPGSAEGSYLFDAKPWVDAGFFIITDDDGRPGWQRWEEEHRLVKGAAYPRNVELDVQVRTRSVPSLGTSTLSPENYFARAVHYSLIALPETPMKPRLADVRVGYYGQTFVSVDAVDGGSLKRTYINRWDLSRRGHITYHVDPSVPPAWRQTVKEGVEAWNRAFVAAGHPPNTVRALLPGDRDWPADYAAGDSRYSSITWAPTVGSPAAYGPSDWDPRSGEVLNADILIPATFVQSYAQRADTYLGEGAANARAKRGRRGLADPSVEAQLLSDGAALVRALHRAGGGLAAGAPIGGTNASSALGATPRVDKGVATYVRQAMRHLIMHETGHTLGLVHNFRGSTAVPFAKLSDAAYVAASGLTGSVMDYVPALVRADPADHSFYYSPTVGTYDVEAIRYGYATFQSDTERLAVAQGVARDNAFATDIDGPSTDGIDPLTSYGDMGATPLDYNEEVLAVARRALDAGLDACARTPGGSWLDFTADAVAILRTATNAVAYATKYIGGVVPSRAASGGGGGGAAAAAASPPVMWVDAATQERALRLILRELSPYGNGLLGAAAAAQVGPYSVERVCSGGGRGTPIDQCLGVAAVDVAATWRDARGVVIDALTAPARLAQVADVRVAVGGSGAGGGPSVSAVLSRVTATFFGPPAGAVPGGGAGGRPRGSGADATTAALARDAQAQWVGHLLRLAAAGMTGGGDGGEPHPAASAAVVAELSSIHAAMATGGHPGGGGVEEDAHRAGLATLTARYAA